MCIRDRPWHRGHAEPRLRGVGRRRTPCRSTRLPARSPIAARLGPREAKPLRAPGARDGRGRLVPQ
eukprot:3988167-Alexandrium_andersonii.AAC.1